MQPGFRGSMSLVHTWAGVTLGALLFAIFWMGTLSVFDREIDRWMIPSTRLALPDAPASGLLDSLIAPQARDIAPDARHWSLQYPTARTPYFTLAVRDRSGTSSRRYLDAAGAQLGEPGTLAATGFLYPFHYSLHLDWRGIGHWIVGAAAMAMLLILVSGVVIHRRIFADFFTFRPRKKLQRSVLDLHNLTGVLGLPFHIAITLSGLVIFFAIYFPTVIGTAYQGDRKAFDEEALGDYRRAKAGQPASAVSLDRMVAEAQRLWAVDGHPGSPRSLRVWHPGDANSVVEIRRAYSDRVAMTQETVYFDAATGAVLFREYARPVRTAQRFLSGLHFIQFEHWTLRWLYFAAGLSGCAMIATGLLFWIESRREKHARQGLAGAQIVETMTIGSVTGIIIATLAFFIANRLLASDADFEGASRAELEVWIFYLTWIATFLHAIRRSWREQCWIIAALALLAIGLNAVTTGDHLFRTIRIGYWPVAGMDLMLLALALLAAFAARKLRRRKANSPTQQASNA